MEPSRSGAANACRVVVSTLTALAAALAHRRSLTWGMQFLPALSTCKRSSSG
jgi:hypothetical protein